MYPGPHGSQQQGARPPYGQPQPMQSSYVLQQPAPMVPSQYAHATAQPQQQTHPITGHGQPGHGPAQHSYIPGYVQQPISTTGNTGYPSYSAAIPQQQQTQYGQAAPQPAYQQQQQPQQQQQQYVQPTAQIQSSYGYQASVGGYAAQPQTYRMAAPADPRTSAREAPSSYVSQQQQTAYPLQAGPYASTEQQHKPWVSVTAPPPSSSYATALAQPQSRSDQAYGHPPHFTITTQGAPSLGRIDSSSDQIYPSRVERAPRGRGRSLDTRGGRGGRRGRSTVVRPARGGSGNHRRDDCTHGLPNQGTQWTRDDPEYTLETRSRRTDNATVVGKTSDRNIDARASPSRPSSPASGAHEAHLPAYQLGASPSLDYLEVSRRFERLVMPPDFVRAVHCWASGGPPERTFLPRWGRDLDLSSWAPMHHEACPHKVEDGPLQAYDPMAANNRVSTEQNPYLTTTHPSINSKSKLSKNENVVYNAKVLLFTGLSSADRAAALAGRQNAGGDHITRLLKFVVARAERSGVKSGIFALGGRCDVDKDGDPAVEGDAALRHAAMRHIAAQTGLDLSKTKGWTRLLEVHYRRRPHEKKGGNAPSSQVLEFGQGGYGSVHEVTVVFLVDDAHVALPDEAEWPDLWEHRHSHRHTQARSTDSIPATIGSRLKQDKVERLETNAQEVTEDGELVKTESKGTLKGTGAPTAGTIIATPPPASPKLLLIGLNNTVLRLKTMSISLDGLLDYNESDKEEATFELSLSAESLHELFMRDAGDAVLQALIDYHQKNMVSNNYPLQTGSDESPDVVKRKFPETPAAREVSTGDVIASVNKKIKVEDPSMDTRPSEEAAHGIEDSSGHEDDALPAFIALNGEEEEEECGDVPGNGDANDSQAVVDPTPIVIRKDPAQESEDLLLAWNYFDASGSGYLTVEEVTAIIGSLGRGLHQGAVRELCEGVASNLDENAAKTRGLGMTLDYRRLCLTS